MRIRVRSFAAGLSRGLRGAAATYGRGNFVHEMAICVRQRVSACDSENKSIAGRTNVDQEGAITLLVDDVVAQDLVVEGLGRSDCAGHCVTNRWRRVLQEGKKRKRRKRQREGMKSPTICTGSRDGGRWIKMQIERQDIDCLSSQPRCLYPRAERDRLGERMILSVSADCGFWPATSSAPVL